MAALDVRGALLQITPLALGAALREAERAYPEEGCGFLLGPATPRERVDGCRIIENIQNSLHARAPHSFPATGRDAYLMPCDALLLLAAPGEPAVKVIFHSHPDSGAHFSQADHESALAGGATPAWPVQHLVISVPAGKAASASLFDYDLPRQRFARVREFRLQECLLT